MAVTLNDERYAMYTDEVPMFLEDPNSVEELNIALKTKLQESERDAGKVIQGQRKQKR